MRNFEMNLLNNHLKLGAAESIVGSPECYSVSISVEDTETSSGDDAETNSQVDLAKPEGKLEPYVGMKFESETAAKMFYDTYARNTGFTIRTSLFSRSRLDGKVISRRFVCSKEGFYKRKNNVEVKFKRRPVTRQGCKAMIMVKKRDSGNWELVRFVNEHNHDLAISAVPIFKDEKDKIIHELTLELRRVNRRCSIYRNHLLMIKNDMEERRQRIYEKSEGIFFNIRKLECDSLLFATPTHVN